MKKIVYKVKNVYGNENKYIVNPDDARVVSQLTGKKTIDNNDILALRRLGCKEAEKALKTPLPSS